MSENVLIHDESTPEQVKSLPGLFPLDWKTQEVKFDGGKLSHTLRRPTTEELLARDAEIQTAIDIGKDGSYKLPDPTADEETDAKYYDKLVLETAGYPGDVPVSHRANAFQGLFKREVYVDEDASMFDDEVAVFEEVGGDPPAFTIKHTLRQPEEAELKLYRKKMQTGEMKPGKRGRQQFVTKSNLRTAMDFYDKWIVRIEGATVGGEELSHYRFNDNRAELATMVDPLIKRMVVTEFTNELLKALQD